MCLRFCSTSTNGGHSWSPIEFDSTLISPICEGSVGVGPSGSLYFSNPAATTERANLTVRRTAPNTLTGLPSTWLLAPGFVFGGYTSLAVSEAITVIDGEPCGGALYERNNTTTDLISFALFPLEF